MKDQRKRTVIVQLIKFILYSLLSCDALPLHVIEYPLRYRLYFGPDSSYHRDNGRTVMAPRSVKYVRNPCTIESILHGKYNLLPLTLDSAFIC